MIFRPYKTTLGLAVLATIAMPVYAAETPDQSLKRDVSTQHIAQSRYNLTYDSQVKIVQEVLLMAKKGGFPTLKRQKISKIDGKAGPNTQRSLNIVAGMAASTIHTPQQMIDLLSKLLRENAEFKNAVEKGDYTNDRNQLKAFLTTHKLSQHNMAQTVAKVPVNAQNTQIDEEEIGRIIQEYLMDNPNVIFEAIEAYRAQQEQESQKRAEEKISSNIEYLTRGEAPFTGNPKADITVIEFFDYNCGYCKRVIPDIQNILKDDDNVRFVFKEMPILGPTSKTAALWALAAHKQDKYFDYHVALMDHKGPKNEEQLAKLAKKMGLDVEKMKKDAASSEIKTELNKAMDVARQIGVSGTPAFIVGKTFIPGYVGEEGLKDAIKAEREKMKNGG